MPIDSPFQRPKRYTFPTEGVDVNSPIDTPRNRDKAWHLKNLTVDSDGSLTIRPGLVAKYGSALIAGKTPVYSAKRVSDPDGTWAMIYGVQDRLANELSTTAGTINNVDGPYSGNPLTIIPWRPNSSIKPYSYIYDSSRQRKLAIDSTTVKTIGIAPPTVPPNAELEIGYFGALTTGEIVATDDPALWAVDGTKVTADAALAGGRIAAGVTVTKYLRDAEGDGACIQPSSLANIGPGSLITLTLGPDVQTMLVREVYRKSNTTANALEIASIIYDSGSTGLCTIQPNIAISELRRNALIQISGGTTEKVRILETIPGSDDTVSFRCVTATNHVAGDDMQVLDTIRVTPSTTEATDFWNTAAISKGAIRLTTGTTGQGYVESTGLTLNLTRLPTNFTPSRKPFTDEDYFHVSLRCTDWSQVTMVRVLFDFDNGTFNQNYSYWAIEQSKLTEAAKGRQKLTDAQKRRLQDRIAAREPYLVGTIRDRSGRSGFGPDFSGGFNQYEGTIQDSSSFTDQSPDLPDPPLPAGETGTGDNQWSEIRWKRGAMFRVGSDPSKGWHNVVAVRIEITIASSTPLIDFNSLTMYGGSAPDIGDTGLPYQYRFRYRDSSTGATSGYSPASRGGVLAWRNAIDVSVTGGTAADADKIDIERFGGLQGGWCYVGTIDNPGAGVSSTFTDTTSNLAAERNRAVSDLDISQPWVRPIAPLSGVCNVAGSAVDDNGTNPINEKILPGTLIIVNGVATSIRRLFGSGSTRDRWELNDSVGSGTNVKWECPDPYVYGQPLARVFGPFENCLFACDGSYVRWTLGFNPDATHSLNRAEIGSPADPTIGGFVFNGRAGVLTAHRLYSISGDPVNGFSFTEVPFGKGAYSPYGIAVGPRVAWIARDGIYESAGGEPVDITTADLAPLFPLEGRLGVDTGLLKAPKIDSTEQKYLRLAYLDDDSLMFSYRDSAGAYHHLRYVHQRKRWFPYDYSKQVGGFYALEGDGTTGLIALGADTPDAKVYTVGGSTNPTTDDGTGFPYVVRTFADDLNDPRSRKYLGDLVIDVDPANQTTGITTKLLTDNETTSTTLSPVITGATRVQQRMDLGSGDGIRARNFSLELSGTTEANKKPRLFLYEMAILARPETIGLRATDYSTLNYDGDKYMQGFYIEADTFGVNKTLRVEYDGGQLGDTITINHNGRRREAYSFAIPFTARLVRIATVDTDPWELYDVEWRFNPEPPAAKVWRIQFTGFDIPGYKHLYHVRPALASAATVTMKLYADSNVEYHTQTIAATGGSNYDFLRRPTLIVPAKKFKLWAAEFSSATAFRMYMKDVEVLVKGWGAGGDYQLQRPFGDMHRTEGARI